MDRNEVGGIGMKLDGRSEEEAVERSLKVEPEMKVLRLASLEQKFD
jgi:hypothetical protein